MIETYPEDQISVKGGKGVRKTWLEGYSEVKDFYQRLSRIAERNDYRRTLLDPHCQRMNRERLIFVFTTTVVVNIPGLRLKL